MRDYINSKKAVFIFIMMFSFGLSSCTPEPEPIMYGYDGCEYCKMTISDPRYGTELVTQKGKVHKFDSIECMASFLHEQEEIEEPAYTLVTGFESPEELIDVNKAVILQSEGLPSPMGMYLTAFNSPATAKQYQQDKGGTILSWEETLALKAK